MARKKIMKLHFLPSCVSPRTLSFRAENAIFKTINSAYAGVVDAPSDPASFVSEPEDSAAAANAGESVEAVIRGLRNADRLFFEPGETSSILDEAKGDCFPFKESVAMELDSNDPCRDFKISMEEMVAAHGLKDLESLEELLSCYLKVNGKSNHGYIVGAFVDLLSLFVVGGSRRR
ncbi:transcription repressor OFP13-like isoform X2 [Diospyros lotus]|uniref:transcription repressor OFP13-like isoform X2 n=1 Tax=Diospyros lotus TaxID=55363 RepID=UPI0022512D0D|nr:transcription repressor OFP13-like isoform X2 [Diospyros lotus]